MLQHRKIIRKPHKIYLVVYHTKTVMLYEEETYARFRDFKRLL